MQWLAFVPKEFKLSGFGSYGREAGGVMLSVTGLNHFYYVRDFTDMRCKHSRVLSVIPCPSHSCETDFFHNQIASDSPKFHIEGWYKYPYFSL